MMMMMMMTIEEKRNTKEEMENTKEEMEEEMMQQLRFKATELLLREEWKESIQLYSQFISLCKQNTQPPPDQVTKLQKPLCLAFSNRAEARSRLRDFTEALEDCDQALEIENTHFKTLLCKGKILLNLNQYSNAYDCFKRALSDVQNTETLTGYLDRCKKLEFQSRTGIFDLSDWVLNGFKGKSPELAEFIGSIEIRKSDEKSGRGLFATKNIESGSLVLVTKAVAIDRGILSECSEDFSENARLVMWKGFVDKVLDAATKCRKTHCLISMLSTGEDEEQQLDEVPDINLFRPEVEEGLFCPKVRKPEKGEILNILDVNSLTEDAVSAKVLGKNCDYYGVGLWILACFINHSCEPNSRRLHIGDHLMVHASRDIKAGEEITFAYFDVLTTLSKRREMSKTWGFHCHCKRCLFEEELNGLNSGLREIEIAFECGSDIGGCVVRLEEGMKRWILKGGKKEKGYLRASFWRIYSDALQSEKVMRKWGRRIPSAETVAESIMETVGGDERVAKMVIEGLRRSSNGSGIGVVEMEKAMKMGRCVYGKVMKNKAMRALLEL